MTTDSTGIGSGHPAALESQATVGGRRGAIAGIILHWPW